MPYPERLLAPDEHVLIDTHPHWKRLVRPALVLVVTAGVAGFLAALVPGGSAQRWLRLAIVVVAVVVVLRWTVLPWLRWLTTRYVLTSKRIVLRDGVLSRRGRDVPLTRVNDVSFQHSLLERMLGCGTLTIESAGEHGQVVLSEVPDVEGTQRAVYDAVEALGPAERG